MVSDLLLKQQQFSYLVGKLLVWCWETQHLVTLGEAYRSDEQAELNAMGGANRQRAADLIATQFPELAKKIRNNVGSGIRTSLHGDRLAIDLQLFDVLGNYQTSVEAYRLLGAYWKSLGGSWGGDFKDANGRPAPDPGHFSLAFGGRQ